VILGLLCPFYIAKLEFKSKEELQLMPQTEEEHLIGLEEENESIEGQPTDAHCNMEPDAEVSIQSRYTDNKNCCQLQTPT
jgi:transient receptor potential cation channel subfamily M protein 3